MTSSFSVGVPRRVRTRNDSAISSRVRGVVGTIVAFLLFTFSAMPPLSRAPQKAAVSCFAFILASRAHAALPYPVSPRKKGKRERKSPAFAQPCKPGERKSGADAFDAPAPLACYEAVVEFVDPLVEEPDEEPLVDPAEPLDDEELPVPVEPLVEEPSDELPEPLLPEPPVCEPDVLPDALPEPPVAEPVELPVPLVLPDSVPLVDEPLVLPDPEAELSDDAVPS